MSIFYAASTKGFYDSTIHEVTPSDSVEITPEYHQELLEGQASGKQIQANEQGYPVLVDPPVHIPTDEEIISSLSNAVQEHLDKEAQKLGYDNIKSAVTYAEEPVVAKFQLEGIAFREWRSLVWAKCYIS